MTLPDQQHVYPCKDCIYPPIHVYPHPPTHRFDCDDGVEIIMFVIPWLVVVKVLIYSCLDHANGMICLPVCVCVGVCRRVFVFRGGVHAWEVCVCMGAYCMYMCACGMCCVCISL